MRKRRIVCHVNFLRTINKTIGNLSFSTVLNCVVYIIAAQISSLKFSAVDIQYYYSADWLLLRHKILFMSKIDIDAAIQPWCRYLM